MYIYRVSRYYTRCEVWHGDKSHERLGTSTLVPDKGLTWDERQRVIREWLRERFGLRLPVMKRTTKGRKS